MHIDLKMIQNQNEIFEETTKIPHSTTYDISIFILVLFLLNLLLLWLIGFSINLLFCTGIEPRFEPMHSVYI